MYTHTNLNTTNIKVLHNYIQAHIALYPNLLDEMNMKGQRESAAAIHNSQRGRTPHDLDI